MTQKITRKSSSERDKLHSLVDSLANVLEREKANGLTFDEIVEKHRLNLRDPFYIYFLSISKKRA